MGSPVRPITVTGFPNSVKGVTPSDANNLTDHDGNEVGQQVQSVDGGDVAVQPVGNPDGTTFVYTVGAGEFIPAIVKKVLATGTTSSTILGYF